MDKIAFAIVYVVLATAVGVMAFNALVVFGFSPIASALCLTLLSINASFIALVLK